MGPAGFIPDFLEMGPAGFIPDFKGKSGMNKGIEFDVLDVYGTKYHRWVLDIEQTFIAKDLTETIFPNPTQVDDFNRDMHCLQAQLSSCEVEKSDADMIEKTFSTFPSAAKILMNLYRLEFQNKRITTFSSLMTQLLMEEKNNMINDQHNLHPSRI
ncbi:hypothetical protein ACLB2K_020885 [Fragaria x ananassa]